MGLPLRIGFGLLAAGFLACAMWAYEADTRSLSDILRGFVAPPWALVATLDLYLGFLCAGVWIFSQERQKPIAAAWLAALLLFGNLILVLWLLTRYRRSTRNPR